MIARARYTSAYIVMEFRPIATEIEHHIPGIGHHIPGSLISDILYPEQTRATWTKTSNQHASN